MGVPYPTWFSYGGEFFVLEGDEAPAGLVFPVLRVGDARMVPGEPTDMSGFFIRPVEYVGVYRDGTFPCMIFKVHEKVDLFGRKKFYEVVSLLGRNRILTVTGPGQGRDYLYKGGGIWK